MDLTHSAVACYHFLLHEKSWNEPVFTGYKTSLKFCGVLCLIPTQFKWIIDLINSYLMQATFIHFLVTCRSRQHHLELGEDEPPPSWDPVLTPKGTEFYVYYCIFFFFNWRTTRTTVHFPSLQCITVPFLSWNSTFRNKQGSYSTTASKFVG